MKSKKMKSQNKTVVVRRMKPLMLWILMVFRNQRLPAMGTQMILKWMIPNQKKVAKNNLLI